MSLTKKHMVLCEFALVVMLLLVTAEWCCIVLQEQRIETLEEALSSMYRESKDAALQQVRLFDFCLFGSPSALKDSQVEESSACALMQNQYSFLSSRILTCFSAR